MSKKAYIPYIIYIVLFVALSLIELISVDGTSSISNKFGFFDLISVSSILGGFMFTALSILISISYTEIVRMLEESGHMDTIYFNITVGLIMAFLAIILSIVSIFVDLPVWIYKHSYMIILLQLKNYLIVFLVGGCIISFGLSILDLKFIVKRIRQRLYKKTSYKDNKELFNRIKRMNKHS